MRGRHWAPVNNGGARARRRRSGVLALSAASMCIKQSSKDARRPSGSPCMASRINAAQRGCAEVERWARLKTRPTDGGPAPRRATMCTEDANTCPTGAGGGSRGLRSYKMNAKRSRSRTMDPED